jgi:MYXO-CTERM domain-containing protein
MGSWRRLAAAAVVWAGTLGAPGEAAAVIDPGSATTLWRASLYPSTAPDWADDQRTGIPEADIVGDTSHAGVYVQFDDAGTPSRTDGQIAFRVRLGADKNPVGFEHFFGVGVDANADGELDLFIGVDNSGNPDRIALWDPGPCTPPDVCNVSPSTTTIVNPPLTTYAETASNYGWRAVDAVIDPLATIFDIDNDGNVDYFLSFVVPFADVVNALVAAGFPAFDDRTPVQYVIGTSTQPNALNQDLGGPDGGTTSSLTWAALGAISFPDSASPEPAGIAPVALALAALAVRRRRRA